MSFDQFLDEWERELYDEDPEWKLKEEIESINELSILLNLTYIEINATLKEIRNIIVINNYNSVILNEIIEATHESINRLVYKFEWHVEKHNNTFGKKIFIPPDLFDFNEIIDLMTYITNDQRQLDMEAVD